MRKIKYRKLGNGHYELHTVADYAGEYIGMNDINNKPIYEGDRITAYDIMLKEPIEGKVEYVAPSFCITCDGYKQSLSNVINIKIELKKWET